MTDEITNATAGQIRAFVERVERLKEEIKGLNEDVSDVYKEVKGAGFDVKALKHIVSLRSKDQNEVQEFEAVVELYKDAIGMGFATRAPARAA